ncbi:restriction endonuclease subunit S [Nostoc sp. ChiSLP03a]|uniref:restriction endonuclease subunit S n=1 Tax=Nostoc sp. ChiSLP03a TaxID=3075380 RepID=UPI002AD2F2F6|nr:restriction endonuclease subunit S [Nostoc sp. ChiSLP03a]MDZ8210250.1 restriction endonuclease subunit S [Nostoc sp. ChiSLP03a]
MSKKVNPNIPQLRFPDFEGSWKTESIQSLLDRNIIIEHLDGNHGELYPRSEEFSDEGIPYISANDLDGQNVNLNNSKKLPIERARLFKKGIGRSGDVIFAHNATVGTTGILKTELEFVILSTSVTYYRCDLSQLNNQFLLYSFNTSYFVRQFSRVMSQSTRNQVPITTQRKFYLHFPKIAEQEKIASFLGAVDRRLTQLRRKQELLQTYKRGVMQKIFSQQIRFTQPDGSPFPDWETDRIDNFLVRYIDPIDVQSDTEYKQIGIRSHGKGIFHKDPVTGKALGNKRVYWVHPKSFVVNIVFAWEQAVALTSSEEEDFIASHRFLMFLPKKSRVNLEFILLFFLGSRGKSLLELASPGGAGRNKTLGQQNFSELKITLPKIEEQEKIANFLAAIDRKIETLSRKIDQTEQFKKGLLQKMFV